MWAFGCTDAVIAAGQHGIRPIARGGGGLMGPGVMAVIGINMAIIRQRFASVNLGRYQAFGKDGNNGNKIPTPYTIAF